ncbi:uncharacterized protein LOC142541819 [Primulina tabacum]|uniref:uncharacterized protein LOC142541819 n=1 Tax=Primulina tabacum TaxID=48773 RepID=UPI003F5AAC58
MGKTKEELQKATETLSKFNSRTSKIESIVSMGRDDKKGLGFKDSVHETGESSKSTVFVKGKTETFTPPQSTPSTKSFPPKRQPSAPVPKKRKRRYVCHYCFKTGHIRPYCFKLRDDLMNQKSSRMLPQMLHNTFRNTSKNRPTVRQEWVPKVKIHCNGVYTSLKTNTAGYWYFDSGSSRHMIGSREYLIDYVEQKYGRVTYGGGAKRKIVGKGTLNIEGLPKLHNVLHVEGLNSNLISISQLCDDNLHVKFNKHMCEVFDESNICIMTGTRSSDNCYQIGEKLSCKRAQITELDLWHQKLGLVNLKTLKNLSKYEAVQGMPNLSSGIPFVCGECQKGKQTRVSHPVLATSGTTRCLELLHMDLMGLIEVESFGGKVSHTSFRHQKLHNRMGLPNEKQNTSRNGKGDADLKEYLKADQLAKFDSKSEKCLFLGYATNSRAYHLKKKTIEDDVDDLLENPTILENAGVAPDVATPSTTYDTEVTEVEDEANSDDDTAHDGKNIPTKIQRNHPSSQIIGSVEGEVQTRKKEKVDYRKMAGLICIRSAYSQVRFSCFVSQCEPKNVDEALKDEFWINAMHDELDELIRNDVWDLVPPPDHVNIIGTRWIFKNKTDESGNIIRNKARLVAQG